MNNTSSTLLDAALYYAHLGITVFPVVPRGKVPAVKWLAEASTDLDVITKWWTNNSNYNIGLVTGSKSGFAVIDFDTDDAWKFGTDSGLPEAPTVKTAKGYHVYCKYSDGIRNFQKRSDLPGIDLRAEGGYVVAPPSVHESGAIYSWVDGKGLDELLPGALPDWLFPKVQEPNLEALSNGVAEGSRNNALVQLLGRWISMKKSFEDVVDIAIRWNLKNRPPLPEQEVVVTVNSIWKKEYGVLPKLNDEWDDPILFEGLNTPDISADILPSWLGDYARAVSKSTQSPEALAVMMGLSTVATSVQKRFEVCPFGDDYKETLSIWTVTVLPPSERKTPVLSAMTAPLIEWETQQATLLEEQKHEVDARIAVDLKRIAKLEKEATEREDDVARIDLIRQIKDLRAGLPEQIRFPKLWTGDVTVERLQDLLVEHGERMSVISDEGGIFEIMAGLYSDGKVNIDVFLQGYSGTQVRVERKTRSVTLRRPALTFGLTVQPTVIESFSSGSRKAFRGKGALARILFCMPKSMLGSRDVNTRIVIPAATKLRYEDGMRRLLGVPKNVDVNGIETPRLLTLSAEALVEWKEFSQHIEAMLGHDGVLHVLNDWGGKLAGTCARIAGLMHLVEHGPENLVINADTVRSSVMLCNYLIEHAKAAYGMIGADVGLNGAKKIYEWMKRRDFECFTRTQCHSAHHSLLTTEQLDKSLKILIERNHIKMNPVETGGRPVQKFTCNPKLRTGSAVS